MRMSTVDCREDRADDPAVVLDQLAELGLVTNRDGTLPETVEQPRDQRVAHDQARAARMLDPIQRLPRQQADCVGKILQRAKRVQQRRNVSLADHHAAEHHKFPARRPHPREIIAEFSSVERQNTQRPAAKRGAWQGVIIGMNRRRRKCHAGFLLEIIEHGRASREKGREPRIIGVIAQYRRKISFGDFDAVGHPGRLALPAAGNPHRAGRSRGGAANHVGLFAENDLEAFERADQRRRHSRRAGADHQKIGLGIPAAVLCLAAGHDNPTGQLISASRSPARATRSC